MGEGNEEGKNFGFDSSLPPPHNTVHVSENFCQSKSFAVVSKVNMSRSKGTNIYCGEDC